MPDQEKHYFFTVLLTDKYLQSSLVSSNGQGTQIKEFSEIKSYFDRRDLLEQLDKSLQQLGQDSQDVVETIFVFDPDWLDGQELSDTKKPIVKEISEELSLDAVGQFSIPEAMAEARLIGDENDSCLLLIFKEDSFNLVFLKHGQFVDLINVGRSNDIVNDFTEALARAAKKLGEEGKYFPNKILMTSIALKQKELESLHEKLVKVDWTTNPGFTQAPDIVVLEVDYMIKSASLSAGKIFAKENLLSKLPKAEQEEATNLATPAESVSAPPVNEAKEHSHQGENEYAIEEPKASSFGIAFEHNSVANHKHDQQSSIKDQAVTERSLDFGTGKSNKKRSRLLRFYLAHQKIILLGFAAGLLGILSIFTVFAFFFSKVSVILSPKQISLQKSAVITLDPNLEESNFSKGLLKASSASKEINGQDVIATTGIGLVGDKAKGKVVIYNKTLEAVQLKEGTVLSSNDIDFLLDQAVEVPAAEEKCDSSDCSTNAGKVETSITANDIGSEANFNKDTKFRVGEYFDDTFSAVAAENFSGGSSREVRVVAQVDFDRLLENLSVKLVEEANKELEEESKDGTYLVPTGKTKVLKSDFSAELGSETESLSLDLTMEVLAVQYSATDLKTLASALLASDLPQDYVFSNQEPSLMSDQAQTSSSSSTIKLNTEISAKAKANLDLSVLKQELLGKNWLEMKNDLESRDEIDQVEVVFSPPFLASILKTLPNDTSRVLVGLDE